MAVIIFNLRGLAMCAIAFGIAFAAGKAFDFSGEGPFMIIAGPILAVCDIGYRLVSDDGHLFAPHRGGSLFFLPAWCFGVFWFVLGIVYTVQAHAA